MSPAVFISNAALGDTTSDTDRGSWNVSRAQRDCWAGHYQAFGFDIAETVEASSAITVDEDKIAAMVADPARHADAPPLIFIEEDGKVWLIDGHHRVRALHRLGFKECLGFVIPHDKVHLYRIGFNGEWVAPWMMEARPWLIARTLSGCPKNWPSAAS